MSAESSTRDNAEAGRAAVFLDRDGVLIANVFYEDSGRWEAPRTPDLCQLYPWAAAALHLLRNAGFALIVISNQPNEALGKSSAVELAGVHETMERTLRKHGIELNASYYCFHHPRAQNSHMRMCDCRKPSPRMVLDAAADHGIDLRRSWMIGDRDTDIECGKRAGLRTIKVEPDHPEEISAKQSTAPEANVKDLLAAAHFVLKGFDEGSVRRGTSAGFLPSEPYRSKEQGD